VYHEYERGANKNFKLFYHFILSMIRYFNHWGWFNNKVEKDFLKVSCISSYIPQETILMNDSVLSNITLSLEKNFDKEKLKKANSKVRNIFRKLMKFANDSSSSSSDGSGKDGDGASSSTGVAGNAYDAITDKDIEILCTKANIDVLNTLNNLMGGESATKDKSLFIMTSTTTTLIQTKLHEALIEYNKDEETIKIAKEIRRRESIIKNEDNYLKKEKIWDSNDTNTILIALKLYPISNDHIERWTNICNYVSYHNSDKDIREWLTLLLISRHISK
jgi:hypothetical protein